MSEYFPLDPALGLSGVHASDFGMQAPFRLGEKYPEGRTGWTKAMPPDLKVEHSYYTTGRLCSCDYCGSLHPATLAAALRQGARGHWADRKYGWPHKFYVEGIPNPFAGMPNSTMSRGYGAESPEPQEPGPWVKLRHGFSSSDGSPQHAWHQVGQEQPTVHGKFYTVHLQDATPEDRDTIERAMGLNFVFQTDGRVGWKPYSAPRVVNAVMVPTVPGSVLSVKVEGTVPKGSGS